MKGHQNKVGSKQVGFNSLRKRIRSLSLKRTGQELMKSRQIETFPTNRRSKKHIKAKQVFDQKHPLRQNIFDDKNPYHLPKPLKSKGKPSTKQKLISIKSDNILHGDKKQKKKKIKKKISVEAKQSSHGIQKPYKDEIVIIPEKIVGEIKKVSPRLKPKVKNPFEKRMKLDKELKNASIIPNVNSHELATVDKAAFQQILQIVGSKT